MATRLLRVSRVKFLMYQREFYRQVEANPLFCNLVISTVETAQSDYDKFIGNSPLTTKTYTVRTLFDFEATGQKREKFGIAEDVDAVIFLSPLSLKKLGITEDIREIKNRVSIVFKGEPFLIDSVLYLEEMYGSYVAMQLNLKTDFKGG